MTTSQQRAALAALDQARPAIGRLDIARDPEDIAADLIEGWQASETALRSLIGSASLSGQPLIREVRQRELLSLDQAHALVEFSAAHDRAQRTDYRPSNADISAARTGFQQLEAALRQERSAAPLSSVAGVAQGASAAPVTAPSAADATPFPVAPARRGFPLIALLAVLLVLGGIAWAVYAFMIAPSGGGALERGIAAYSSGNRTAARNAFAEAIRENANEAEPHIYLGRMAREEGDANTAVRELQRALELEPKNALAQREMGSHLLAQGNAQLRMGNLQGATQSFSLARNFYVRAVEIEPNDRLAQGYLGCALMRIGNVQLANSFLSRAGPGPWSSCTPVGQMPPAGQLPPPVR